MVAPANFVRDALAEAARLLDARFVEGAAAGAERLAQTVESGSPEAAGHLRTFAAEVALLPPGGLAPVYSRTFDLMPNCPPYLSIHLFGEENFKRAILMTGLAELYARIGHDRAGELPDHIAVFLAAIPRLSDDEWSEAARYILPTPLLRMLAMLEHTANPYRHVIQAIQALLAAEFPTESIPCSTSSFSPRSLTSPCSSCSPAPSGDTGPTGSATPPCPHSFSRAGSSCGGRFPGM